MHKKKVCTYAKFLGKKKSFFRKFFFATGLIFERFLAPRSRFFEKVNEEGSCEYICYCDNVRTIFGTNDFQPSWSEVPGFNNPRGVEDPVFSRSHIICCSHLNYPLYILGSFENSYIPENPRTPPISYISQTVIPFKKPTSEPSKTLKFERFLAPRSRFFEKMLVQVRTIIKFENGGTNLDRYKSHLR
ncbi:hypothetical protein LXL04_000729 [Taraxacum kok-saghyz]